MQGNMRLFKCFVPMLLLLLAEDLSARPDWIHPHGDSPSPHLDTFNEVTNTSPWQDVIADFFFKVVDDVKSRNGTDRTTRSIAITEDAKHTDLITKILADAIIKVRDDDDDAAIGSRIAKRDIDDEDYVDDNTGDFMDFLDDLSDTLTSKKKKKKRRKKFKKYLKKHRF